MDKYLILDLDNTLIYTHQDINKHYSTTIELDNKLFYLSIRPNVLEFLKNCSKYYNIIVWSAGGYKYVETIITKLFIENSIKLFLYLDVYYCESINKTTHSNIEEYLILDNNINNETILTKPLYKIIDIINNKNFNYCLLKYSKLEYCDFFKNLNINYNIELKNLTIVDNLFINIIDNPNNGIIIENYYGDIYDIYIEYLQNMLIYNHFIELYKITT